MKKILIVASVIINLSAIDFNWLTNWHSDFNSTRNKCRKIIDEVDNKNFKLFVQSVKNIDGDLVIMVQFRSKNSDYDIDLSKSTITFSDSRGKKTSLNGCDISNFHIYSGEAKLFPFVFKEKANKFKAPYTLRLDLYNIGIITLDDLKIGEKSIEY